MHSESKETLKLLAQVVVKNIVEKYKLATPEAKKRALSEEEKSVLKDLVEKIKQDVEEVVQKQKK